jgi:hypothetical protein
VGRFATLDRDREVWERRVQARLLAQADKRGVGQQVLGSPVRQFATHFCTSNSGIRLVMIGG